MAGQLQLLELLAELDRLRADNSRLRALLGLDDRATRDDVSTPLEN